MSVQFDLSANVEHRPDSPRPIRHQDPSALLRSPFKPTSILIRRPGDIPSPIPLHFSQTSQTSSTSQTFAYFAADSFSPSTTPSPSPELQLSPMARYSPEREPISLPPAVSVAASTMANSLGSLFSSSNPIALKPSGSTLAVEMSGERISLPMESFSQPSPSHSTLFDDLGFSTDQEQDDTVNSIMQKRPLADQSLARKRLRTDPSARRRGALSGTSATKDSSITHRMPAMLRREASYGSGLQRSSNSSSIDLSAFFGPEQQERPSSPLKHEVAQDNTLPHNSDDHSMIL
ncbi:hypothetical protein BGW42_004206 [Actinomortierella wolfii]|nr:hypothetical protein BGW42_004206 [Actinomortierella wolfii]